MGTAQREGVLSEHGQYHCLTAELTLIFSPLGNAYSRDRLSVRGLEEEEALSALC